VPCREESVNFDETQHIFIEGDNLEVLKLLYKPYFGRVKMIYIDPPYNTGNDFIYPDDYADPLATYLQLTGQQDAEGNLLTSNPETSGRYHSAWLSMMYPRLFLARQLLKEDGLIFVSIDDNESHNLRLLMNEVFGEENFLAQITWRKVYGGGAKVKHVVIQHEYVLCYARSKESIGELELPPSADARKRYTEKDEKYPVRGPYFTQPLATTSMDFRPNLRFPIIWQGEEIWPEKQWQWSKERVEQALDSNELVFNKQGDKWSVRYKQYLRDENGEERGSKLYSVLVGPYTQEGTAEIRDFFGDGKVFPFPKPSSLIEHLISCTWGDEGAIILDFFAGSCSAAQAVLHFNHTQGSNCRFIMIQLPEPISLDLPAREASYETIADVGKERIRRAIAQMHQGENGQLSLDLHPDEDLGFKVFKLAPSNLRAWRGVEEDAPDAYARQMELFHDPLVDGWTVENVIYEVALKEGYGLNCHVEPVPAVTGNTVYRVTDPDKEQAFTICLDNAIDLTSLDGQNLSRDDTFVCRDVALDDKAAANLALQCRLKTI
jgi:adenine-specific DNA-methyltransferase